MSEIAIDACVFIHLLNPERNEGAHIDRLLSQLYKDKFMLLLDSTGRIAKDYETQVIPMIRRTDETGNQRILLNYWMQAKRLSVELNQVDPLMRAIKVIIHEVAEHADRAFVYVACRRNATLVTNDAIHIVDRRKQLLKNTKRYRGKDAAIQSSKEAMACFCPNEGKE